jgi:hypothetical protein
LYQGTYPPEDEAAVQELKGGMEVGILLPLPLFPLLLPLLSFPFSYLYSLSPLLFLLPWWW